MYTIFTRIDFIANGNIEFKKFNIYTYTGIWYILCYIYLRILELSINRQCFSSRVRIRQTRSNSHTNFFL